MFDGVPTVPSVHPHACGENSHKLYMAVPQPQHAGLPALEIYYIGPAGAFEQDVAFSSTVFRGRNIPSANACSKCGGTPSSRCG